MHLEYNKCLYLTWVPFFKDKHLKSYNYHLKDCRFIFQFSV